jgi:16S rRNA G966 N2-methylase RsmD
VEILPISVKRALRVLSDRNATFDLIYADPPYSDGASLTVDSSRISAVLKVKGLFVFEQSDQTTVSTMDGYTVEWSKRIGDTRLIAYRYMG